jgi:hypothetical protein
LARSRSIDIIRPVSISASSRSVRVDSSCRMRVSSAELDQIGDAPGELGDVDRPGHPVVRAGVERAAAQAATRLRAQHQDRQLAGRMRAADRRDPADDRLRGVLRIDDDHVATVLCDLQLGPGRALRAHREPDPSQRLHERLAGGERVVAQHQHPARAGTRRVGRARGRRGRDERQVGQIHRVSA